MYRIDRASNNIVKLDQKQFRELRIRERAHLQEWIAKNPEILGEELLIIQKEFDGFNDTSERLDLLALDKDGNLVIIELKAGLVGHWYGSAWKAKRHRVSSRKYPQKISLVDSLMKRIGQSLSFGFGRK